MISRCVQVLGVVVIGLWVAACADAPTEEEGSTDSDRALPGKADGAEWGPGATLYRAGNRYGAAMGDRFLDDVQPVFARRCVTCHGCSDSPCQLKLTSYEGIVRGSNQDDVFGNRVLPVDPSRMQDGRVVDPSGSVDYESTVSVWRSRGFYSVIERGSKSIMHRLLDRAHTLTRPDDLSLAFELYEDGLKGRDFECLGAQPAAYDGPTDDDIAPRAMPFGVQALEQADQDTLVEWLEDHAPGPHPEAQQALETPFDETVIARWESFLNQKSNRARLMSRYIYEHLFTGRLHFPESPGEYYELVRSWTPPSKPIDEIVTELPNDDPRLSYQGFSQGQQAPGENRWPYYRLRKYTPIIVQKNHITLALTDAVMARWQALFLAESDNSANGADLPLPGYDNHNPFVYFESIPSMDRYQFLLDNAFYLIDAMVRGDVCNGSTATYAIRDHFWVWFLKPESDPSAIDPKLGRPNWEHLVPGDAAIVSREWQYLSSYEKQLRRLRPGGLSIQDIWVGDGVEGQHPWLTLLRHDKNATVHRGAVGGRPETLWLLNYANLERLYYNLVVAFKPWGHAGHKMEAWKYMGFVRAEAEDLVVSLLPEVYRVPVRDAWTTGFGGVYQDVFFPTRSEGRPSQVVVDGARPMADLIEQVREVMTEEMTGPPDPLNRRSQGYEPLPRAITTRGGWEMGLATLTAEHSEFVQYLPNVTMVRVGGETGWPYSIVAHRGYAYHNQLFMQALARDPERDSVSAIRGLAGNYPELFVDIPLDGALTFLKRLRAVESEKSWEAFKSDYSRSTQGRDLQLIRRNSPEFWPFLDWLHAWNINAHPIEAGILDVSEYGWP